MTTLRCVSCGHVLGVVQASGAVVSKHRGRESTVDPGSALVRLRCERCGTINRPQANVTRHGPHDVEKR